MNHDSDDPTILQLLFEAGVDPLRVTKVHKQLALHSACMLPEMDSGDTSVDTARVTPEKLKVCICVRMRVSMCALDVAVY
jgi:hypothetical protein